MSLLYILITISIDHIPVPRPMYSDDESDWLLSGGIPKIKILDRDRDRYRYQDSLW